MSPRDVWFKEGQDVWGNVGEDPRVYLTADGDGDFDNALRDYTMKCSPPAIDTLRQRHSPPERRFYGWPLCAACCC